MPLNFPETKFIIAILDTGLDATHPIFEKAHILPQVEINNQLEIYENEPHDPAGHGTSVAGLIHQICPEATLLPVRVLTSNLRQSRHDIIRVGALAALAKKANILNCSFGVPATPRTALIYKDWIDQAFDSQIEVVAADQKIPDIAEWPCDFRTTYAVANSDDPLADSSTPSSRPMAFLAPGSNIKVPTPGGTYAYLTGCSFSTAQFSGHLAQKLMKLEI